MFPNDERTPGVRWALMRFWLAAELSMSSISSIATPERMVDRFLVDVDILSDLVTGSITSPQDDILPLEKDASEGEYSAFVYRGSCTYPSE